MNPDFPAVAVCGLCPHHCRLSEGKTGACLARRCVDGKIVSINYGKLTSIALDPIEKKPLYHFHPGSMILSVGSYGCNLHCPFCQNSEISQCDLDSAWHVRPEALVRKALQMVNEGNIGIAYTYNEPIISYEYVMDCAALVHENGLLNVLVTNGMICDEPLSKLLPLIDAMNIDLKGFTQRFYDMVGGDLGTVKNTIVKSVAAHCHVEITTLIIPHENDSIEEIINLSQWIASISPDIPLHISRFFPTYKMTDRQATPVGTIYKLVAIAKRYLRYVYSGNCC